MDKELGEPLLRIGAMSKRVGVTEHLLRAWEMRYGLTKPARSVGGYRLYTLADEYRVRRMLAYLSQGLAAAQAARAALAEEIPGSPAQPTPPSESFDIAQAYSALQESFDHLDEPAVQAVLDRVFSEYTVETAIRELILPYLQEIGRRWADNTLSIGQEHFASNVIRGRLAELARGWGGGDGPSAILACPPHEEHEIPLLMSGIVLHRNGWRIRYLGANTPMGDLLHITSQIRPALVLMSSPTTERFVAVIPELAQLSALAPLVLSGRGATRVITDQCGARRFPRDPVTTAEDLVKEFK